MIHKCLWLVFLCLFFFKCKNTCEWTQCVMKQYTYLNYCCNCFEVLATISITVTFVLEWIRLGFGVLRVYTPFKGEECSSVPSLRLMLPPLEALCWCFFLFLIKIFPMSSWGLGSCLPGSSCKNNKNKNLLSNKNYNSLLLSIFTWFS